MGFDLRDIRITYDPLVVYWTLVSIVVILILGYFLHKLLNRMHENRERRRFFERIFKIGAGSDEEDVLVDMVNQSLEHLGTPLEIYRSIKIYDRVASMEIKRIMRRQGPVEEKRAKLDCIYSLREKMFPSPRLAVPTVRSVKENAEY
jgi:hypothetical protein